MGWLGVLVGWRLVGRPPGTENEDPPTVVVGNRFQPALSSARHSTMLVSSQAWIQPFVNSSDTYNDDVNMQFETNLKSLEKSQGHPTILWPKIVKEPFYFLLS